VCVFPPPPTPHPGQKSRRTCHPERSERSKIFYRTLPVKNENNLKANSPWHRIVVCHLYHLTVASKKQIDMKIFPFLPVKTKNFAK
jgi:hypothetical protein